MQRLVVLIAGAHGVFANSSPEHKKSATPIEIYKELLTLCAQVTNCAQAHMQTCEMGDAKF